MLRKKVEILTLSQVKLAEETNNNINNLNKEKQIVNLDTSKFLEITIFDSFQRHYFKELENLKRFSEEVKRYVDDIIDSIKNKADINDLKKLDELLSNKIEEIKINFNKKFADKTETNKNVKYLDLQIKQIVDSLLKKNEKGDNWLIAKKPVGGYACASCESYIGKLQDGTQHIPWNKYPQRDGIDKAYRVKFNKINFV